MPATPQINLDIRNSRQNQQGWVDVQATNNQWYSYRFTGGDDGAGGLVQQVKQGRDTAPVRLTADQRYQLADTDPCVFSGDLEHQLSWSGQSPYTGSIVDANTKVEPAKYTLNVKDTGNGNCIIPCDPQIKNE
jgi:hypothetical protein